MCPYIYPSMHPCVHPAGPSYPYLEAQADKLRVGGLGVRPVDSERDVGGAGGVITAMMMKVWMSQGCG